MSSYFDFFCKNIENYGTHDTEKIQGTCYSMCPHDEVTLRERNSLVHMLEVVGAERRLVKSYSRSAADSNMAVPLHLRPFTVLQPTVDYLLFEVTKRSDVPLSVVYDFVNDRLRAVRQDMTIQRLAAGECARLLEPMVRFYVYFGYSGPSVADPLFLSLLYLHRLYGLPLKDYDPVLNKMYLLECIKWFLSCCDTLEQTNGKLDELSDCMTELSTNGRKALPYDRVLIESLYILCNLDDINPLFRYLSLSKDLKMAPTLQLAYEVGLANLKGNFVQVGKLLDRMCPLTYCALCLHLPVLQRHAIKVLTHAYNNKRLTVASSVLRRWLCFTSDWETRGVCQHYGLPVEGVNVRFDKGEYKPDAPMHLPKIQLLHNGRLNLDMDHIFTYSV